MRDVGSNKTNIATGVLLLTNETPTNHQVHVLDKELMTASFDSVCTELNFAIYIYSKGFSFEKSATVAEYHSPPLLKTSV